MNSQRKIQEINLLIEKFAIEKETGKNWGKIQQPILENDFSKLKENLFEWYC